MFYFQLVVQLVAVNILIICLWQRELPGRVRWTTGSRTKYVTLLNKALSPTPATMSIIGCHATLNGLLTLSRKPKPPKLSTTELMTYAWHYRHSRMTAQRPYKNRNISKTSSRHCRVAAWRKYTKVQHRSLASFMPARVAELRALRLPKAKPELLLSPMPTVHPYISQCHVDYPVNLIPFISSDRSVALRKPCVDITAKFSSSAPPPASKTDWADMLKYDTGYDVYHNPQESSSSSNFPLGIDSAQWEQPEQLDSDVWSPAAESPHVPFNDNAFSEAVMDKFLEKFPSLPLWYTVSVTNFLFTYHSSRGHWHTGTYSHPISFFVLLVVAMMTTFPIFRITLSTTLICSLVAVVFRFSLCSFVSAYH